MNNPELELLKKEIAYRASRRGTKELDAKFKPFTNPQTLATLPSEDLTLIKQLLLESEAYLMTHIVEGGQLPSQYAPLADYFKA